MMSTPKEVTIAGERHLIILGQFGNLGAKLARLNRFCVDANHHELVGRIGEITEELSYLKKIYPQLDGSIISSMDGLPATLITPDRPTEHQPRQLQKIRNGLLDMRALVDAACTSYTHEGNIPCHLKVMFDNAWWTAANEAGIHVDMPSDIPF